MDELNEQDRQALAAHAERQRGAMKREASAGGIGDPHGFEEAKRNFFGNLRARFAADGSGPEALKAQRSRWEEMLASWRAALPKCPDNLACGGRCALDVLEAWDVASAMDEAFDAEQARRQALEDMRRAVPGRLQALGAPARAVAAWTARPKETLALRGVRGAVEALGLPPEARKHVLYLLCGITGSGKTTAATWAVAEYLATPAGQPRDEGMPLPGFFMAAADVARSGIYGAQAKSLLEAASTADILVVDDGGSEVVAERGPWIAMFDAIINARYGDFLPTIITSNMTPEAFFAQYGERVKSRFHEAGRIVNCGTTDFRKGGVQ